LPKRFYIDRREAGARKVTNEDEVISALAMLGVVPIALERLSIKAQVGLFRDAELIIAPHGAGLANLIWSRPACSVLELLMDAYVNWGFRHLAAMKGLNYDCILGRGEKPWLDLSGGVHFMRWEVSVPHLSAAAAALLDRR
jgi:capsular polysaccharide biosynthesis protein